MRLNREFVVLVGIAFVVALPLSVWAASRWLQDFAYRMELSPGLFVLAGGLALLAALLPVSYHAFRAAASDPATTLRDE
jgi:putative ABC transport system permease protein